MSSENFWISERAPGAPHVACLPGWGFDWRIMDIIAGDFNPIHARIPFQIDGIAEFVRERGLAPVALIGWSLGGFAAVDFARKYPELADRLLLVGVRRSYSEVEIDQTKTALARDPHALLSDFYRRCFLPTQRADWQRFRENLLDDYLRNADIGMLNASLDRLASATIDESSLKIRPTIIAHGARDVVAPADQAQELAKSAGIGIRIVPDASHAAFLHSGFGCIIEEWLK